MYRVLGGFPWLHFADILHVLKLSQLGQCVVAQRLVKWCVTVLVLHVQLGLCPHQQLSSEGETGRKKLFNTHNATYMLCYNANVIWLTLKILYFSYHIPQLGAAFFFGSTRWQRGNLNLTLHQDASIPLL